MKNYIDFADGGFLGYINDELNKTLLDEVIEAARMAPGDSVDLAEACTMANVDYYSLTEEDIEYIKEHF